MQTIGSHPLKRPRPFAREYRRIGPRAGAGLTAFASQPDVVAELYSISDRLRDVPRPWLDSTQDMINALQREGGRIRKLADQIDTIEPIAKRGGAKLARVTERPTPRAARKAMDQMEMAL